MPLDRSPIHRISAHVVKGKHVAAWLLHEENYPQPLLYWSLALHENNVRINVLIHSFLRCLLARLPQCGQTQLVLVFVIDISCGLDIRHVLRVVHRVCIQRGNLGGRTAMQSLQI